MAIRAPLRALRSTSLCEYSLIVTLLNAQMSRTKNPAAAVPVRGFFGVCSLVPGCLSGVRECPAPRSAKEQQQGQRRILQGRCCGGSHECEQNLMADRSIPPGSLSTRAPRAFAGGQRLSLRPVPAGPAVRPSPLAEGLFRREVLPWGLLGLALGLVEGATAAILVKQHFAGVAPPFAVNLAVALVSGAPAFSNVLSFVWANLAHGRARVRLMVALQGAFALLVGCVAFASPAAGGLALAVLSIVAARVLWAGVLTVRAAIWTANYPRNVLARITGRIVIVNSIAVALSAALVGWVLEAHALDARWLYGGGALAGLCGAWLYRATRVRREFRLLAAEAASAARSEPFSLAMFSRILREDPQYREYMLWMGVFGGGTLMLTAQLVLVFSEQLHLTSATQIG